jgi:hypothetical protein
MILANNLEMPTAPISSDTTGEKNASIVSESRPPQIALTAPAVVNRFQNNEFRIAGWLPGAATANARVKRKATLSPARRRQHDGDRTNDKRGNPDHRQLSALGRLAALDDVRIELLRERRALARRRPRGWWRSLWPR